MAQGFRRPMRIKRDDFRVPALSVDDFDLRPYAPEVIGMLGGSELLEDTVCQRQMAIMFIEKVKLCSCIEDILETKYEQITDNTRGQIKTVLVPKRPTSDTFADVKRCEGRLQNWLADLSECAKYTPLDSVQATEAEEVMHFHRALLRIEYLLTSSVLHLPQVCNFIIREPELLELSRSRAQSAAWEITAICDSLHELDLSRYLPNSGVAALMNAAIVHIACIQFQDPKSCILNLQGFTSCGLILRRLSRTHLVAEFAMQILDVCMRTADVSVPVLSRELLLKESKTGLTGPVDNSSEIHYSLQCESITAASHEDDTICGLRISDNERGIFASVDLQTRRSDHDLDDTYGKSSHERADDYVNNNQDLDDILDIDYSEAPSRGSDASSLENIDFGSTVMFDVDFIDSLTTSFNGELFV